MILEEGKKQIENIVADYKNANSKEDKLKFAEKLMGEHLDWLFNQLDELEKSRNRILHEVFSEWPAIVYDEFESDGVKVIHHESIGTNGWWEHFEVEFTYFGAIYSYEYKKHTSTICSDIELVKDIQRKSSGSTLKKSGSSIRSNSTNKIIGVF